MTSVSPRIQHVPFSFGRWCAVRLLAGAIGALLVVSASARDLPATTQVNYNPPIREYQINPNQLPFSISYPLTIQGPAVAAGGSYPVEVTLVKQLTGPASKPPFVSEATALSYITLSGADLVGDKLVFASESDVKTLTVSVAFPADTVPWGYGYKIVTAGWPGTAFQPLAVGNPGTTVNANVSVNNSPQPPLVAILQPVNATVITISPSQLPYSVPLSFDAAVPVAVGAEPAPIFAVRAENSTLPVGSGVDVPLTTNGLNTARVTGTGNLVVTAPGTYYVTVTATNSTGSASAVHSYTVVVNAAPPQVAVTVPAGEPDYTWFVGSAPLEVPNQFVGTAQVGTTISGLAAQLIRPTGGATTSEPVSVAAPGYGFATATGSIQMAFGSPLSGQYTLQVMATNNFGTQSSPATASFWINRVAGPQNAAVEVFGAASFSVAASANIKPGSAYSYRWERQAAGTTGFLPLSDGGAYAGTTTGTLTVTRTTAAMSGDLFRCIVGTNPARMVPSPAASLTVTKRVLTVRALDASRTYGAANPAPFGVQITGQFPGETAEITGAAAVTTVANPASPVGTYALVASPGTLAAVNYTFVFVNGALTVNPAPLTIRADNKSMTAGSTLPALTASYSGLQGADTSAVVTGVALATTATPSSPAGTYPISVTGGTAANYTITRVPGSLTITAAAGTAPTVVINTPAAGATYVRPDSCGTVSVALNFTGTSTAADAVITQLTATVSGPGASLGTLTRTNLGTRVATGTATISISGSNTGTYTIAVTATDKYGTATATRTFSVVQGREIRGDAFFDVDFDGTDDCYTDFGLGGVTLRLKNAANQVIATDVTDACGRYGFSNVAPGTYTITATAPTGFSATNLSERTITVASSCTSGPDFGFGLNFNALRTMTANGYTIGYWKNNIDKALDNKTSGTQVSKSTLLRYTDAIEDFALSVYDDMSLSRASSLMGSTSSQPTSLLSKQLIASEYNYQNGAYLNGNRTLTYAFLTWGEYVLSNPSRYSSSYLTWAKDWFDAYNNSHGGLVNGPAPR
jgi:hypothetical protein